MRALVQRVGRASVAVSGRTVASIEGGLLVLLGVAAGDGEAEAERLARKVVALRIFADDGGRMNRSLVDTGGAALVVSQFTLCADTSRGNRPSFVGAAPAGRGAGAVSALLRGAWPRPASGSPRASSRRIWRSSCVN